MDLHTAVYNAAHDGKLPLLQKLLAGRGREELEELLGEVAGGGTPLLIAASTATWTWYATWWASTRRTWRWPIATATRAL